MLSSPDFIYLDHPYEPDSEERGKYWATRYTDTRKIFGFMPEDLYEDIDKIPNCSGLKKCVDGRQNVLGKDFQSVWDFQSQKSKYEHIAHIRDVCRVSALFFINILYFLTFIH